MSPVWTPSPGICWTSTRIGPTSARIVVSVCADFLSSVPLRYQKLATAQAVRDFGGHLPDISVTSLRHLRWATAGGRFVFFTGLLILGFGCQLPGCAHFPYSCTLVVLSGLAVLATRLVQLLRLNCCLQLPGVICLICPVACQWSSPAVCIHCCSLFVEFVVSSLARFLVLPVSSEQPLPGICAHLSGFWVTSPDICGSSARNLVFPAFYPVQTSLFRLNLLFGLFAAEFWPCLPGFRSWRRLPKWFWTHPR